MKNKKDKNTFTGSLIQAGIVNGNGRMYTAEALEKAVKDFGELDHPMYGELGMPENFTVNLKNVSHQVLDIKSECPKLPRKKKKALKKAGTYNTWKKSKMKLIATIKFLDTPQGKIAKKIINESVIRTAGTGEIDKNGIVQNFKLTSCNLVPKSTDAFKNKI